MKLGITNETRTSGMKRFTLDESVNNGLCAGILSKVELEFFEQKEDSKLKSFAGKKTPRLSFIFNEANGSGGTHIESFTPVEFKDLFETNKRTKALEGSWRIRKQFAYVGHFMEVITGKSLAELNPDLTFDIDPEVELDGDALIKLFEKLYGSINEFFNGKGGKKPIYEGVNLWIKLLLYDAAGEVNNGHPGFPGFLPTDGLGVIERFVEGKQPKMFINIAKGESIKPRATVAQPTDLGNGGGAPPAGVPSFGM